MFEFQGFGGSVADFARSIVLDGAGEDEAGFDCPFIAVFDKFLEGSSVEFDESLLDHGLIFTMAAFDVHHSGQRNCACDPLICGSNQIGDAGHVSGFAVCDDCSSVVTDAVAVVSVKVGGNGAAAFVTEEVSLSTEFDLFAGCFQFSFDQFDEELFGFDERNLNVSVGVAVIGELELDRFGERCKDSLEVCGETVEDEFDLFIFCFDGGEVFTFFCEEVIEFGNEFLHFGDEFDETFGDQDNTEVFFVFSTFDHDVSDVGNDIIECLLFCSDFFGDDGDVCLGFKSAFESNVRSGTAHQLDEVPIFLGGVCIAFDVSDQFAVNLGCGIETEGGFNVLVLEVTVDGFGAADDLDGHVVLLVVFSEKTGVCVGVITADDDEGIDSEGFAVFCTFIELFFEFEFGSSGTDHIESACVAVSIHEFIGDFNVVVVDESAGTAFETEEFGIFVEALDTVIDPCDHVMSAGSLSAGEDDTDVDCFSLSSGISLCECQHRHVAGGGEEGFDFFLVSECSEFFAFGAFDDCACLESGGEFGLIGIAGFLQCGNTTTHVFSPVFILGFGCHIIFSPEFIPAKRRMFGKIPSLWHFRKSKKSFFFTFFRSFLFGKPFLWCMLPQYGCFFRKRKPDLFPEVRKIWNHVEMRYLCKNCREVLTAEESAAGENVVCCQCGRMTEVPQGRFAPGSLIADFEIIRLLAQGDMGYIYLAERIGTGEKIALKILSDDHTCDARFVVEFIHSGRLAMKWKLKNTVQVYAVGEDEGVFYFAMEYISGRSLAEILKTEGMLSIQQSVEIVRIIAETLSEAWKEGKIIHRCIKPDNILFTADGELKLADMGLARDYLDLASRPDEERLRLVQYAPPEALSDFSMSGLDTRSDIYSLGAVFYHAVTGKYPYQNFTVSEIISGQVPLEMVDPVHLNPDLTPEIRAVIRKMLAHNPNDRYRNFPALLESLRTLKCSGGTTVGKKEDAKTHDSVTVKIGAGKRAKVKQLEKVEFSDSHLEKMQRKRESRAQTIVLGIVAILFCLGIFFTLFVKWVVYEPQRSAREMEINIARMKERTRRQKSLYQPLQKGAMERLCRGVVAHCANEDFREALHFIDDFSRSHAVDESFKNELIGHVRKSIVFFRQFTNSGTAVAGIKLQSRFYGSCTVLSVRNSVITAQCGTGKNVSVQIRTFTHEEYRVYLRQVIERFGLQSEVCSYLLCTGNFGDALEKVQDDPEKRGFFEKVIYGYIRTGLSNASPLEIRQMRMLYGSLDAFQRATHPKK